ncbi:phage head spike fiber domain-containing protein [Bacillus solimangrovi]|uniref:CBM-cenC domain-containing protein n=1 Tax=Bacillus solimangrovi TaxID=1305675 RepID=A0A1E5LAN6_9BACI|nr:hypothetical protein [Bacillus solimangrovi]OEH91152.1 hypothetical protein BFG57_07230 [Bacillus solimangrovi]
MNKFGKFLSSAAIATTLATSSFLPSAVFAAEAATVTNQSQNVFVTPLTQSSSGIISKSKSSIYPKAPVPDLVEIFDGYDPFTYDGLPRDTKGEQWGVETMSGALLSYIPIDVYDLNKFMFNHAIMPDPDLVKKFNPNFDNYSEIFLGYVDNDGEFHSYVMGILNEQPNKKGKYGTLALNPDILPADDDSSITSDAYWERVFDSNIDYSGGTKTIVDTASSGISKTSSAEFGSTIGMKVGVEAGLGDIAKVSAEYSTSLSQSFGRSINIHESRDVQFRHTFGERFDDPYAYGVYHLIGEYRFHPSNLVKEIADNIQVWGVPGEGHYTSFYTKNIGDTKVGEGSYPYSTDDYRAIEIYENGLRIPEQNLLDQYSFNDFTDSSWSKNDVSVGFTSVTAPDGSPAQKLTPATNKSGIQQYVNINSDGNKYTFGIWLKADEPHQAQIKVQNKNNSESTGVKVDVTTDWQYFSVTSEKPFSTNDGVTVVLWPGAYNGTTDYVYASGAKLIKE